MKDKNTSSSFLKDAYENSAIKLHNKINRKYRFGSLYHYTKVDTLHAILNSKELWTKNFNRLNDPMEIECSKEIISEAIERYLLKTNNKDFWWKFYNLIYKRDIIKNSSIYLCSFSDEIDYLPCWRWYGDNGKGACIKFNQVSFDSSQFDGDFVGLKMIYSKEVFYNFVWDFLILTNGYVSKTNDHELLSTMFMSNLLSLMPMYKHDGYKYEFEARFYIVELKVGNTYYPCELPYDRKKPSKDDGVLDIFRTPNFNMTDISEIWLGPCCDFQKERALIEETLAESGYAPNSIKIIQSKQHYRGG